MNAFSAENTGSIQVYILPEECQVSFSFWMSNISQWSTNYPSGTVVHGIHSGEIEIRFRQVSDWITPENQTINVEANKTKVLYINCCPIQPSKPWNVGSGDGIHTDYIPVQWKGNDCHLNYHIYRGISDNPLDATLIADQIQGFSYYDYSAEPGKKYYYWVRSFNGYFISEESQYDTGYLRLRPPTNINASDGIYTDKILITFDPVEGASEYEIWRLGDYPADTVTPRPWYARYVTTISDLYYDDTYPTIYEKPYFYWVKAVNHLTKSDFNQSDSGKRKMPKVEKIIASDWVYENMIKIEFNKIDNDEYHGIRYSFYKKDNDSIVREYGCETYNSFFIDRNVCAGMKYDYTVVTRNDYGSNVSNSDEGIAKMSCVTELAASNKLGAIDLHWNYVSCATSYIVYRNDIDDINTAIKIGTSESLRFSDLGISKSYYYWVKAANEYTMSDLPMHPVAGTPITCEYNTSVPEIFFDHNGGKASFTVTPNSGFCHWEVSTSADWIKNIYPITGHEEQTIHFTIAPNNTPLTATVNIDGDGSYYNCSHYSVRVVDNRLSETPATPQNIQASDGTSIDHVVIRWDSNASDHTYEIYRESNNNSEDSVVIAQNVNSNTYNDTSAEPGVHYSYWVIAKNPYAESEKSNYDEGFRHLSPPVDPVATNEDQTQIKLSYNGVDGASEYEIWRGVSSDFSNASHLTTVSNCYFEDKTTIYEKPYVYWMRSVNPLIKSDFTTFVTGKRKMPPVAFVLASDQVFENMVKIEFKTIENDEYHGIKYSLIRDDGNLRRNKRLKFSVCYDGQFEDKSAYAGKTYYYRIKAENSYGYSISGADTGSAKMSCVKGLTASKGSHFCSIRLDWEYVENASLYYIYRNTYNDIQTAVKMESFTNFFWDNNTGRTFFYWVRAANEYTTSNDGDSSENYVIGYPAVCRFNTSVSEIIFDHEGGTASFIVIPSFDSLECSWQITSSVDWINNISPSRGSGEQTITFTIDPNNLPLTGTIDIDSDNDSVSNCNYDHTSVRLFNNRFTLSGNVLYYKNDLPVAGVKLTREGDLDMLDAYTDDNGAYTFPPSPNARYKVTPSYTTRIPEQVITPFDASLLMRYSRNMIALNTHQQLAADVNADGFHDAFDAVLIVSYVTGKIKSFTKDTWIFDPITNHYILDHHISDDYTGIVRGDVSGNWRPISENETPIITNAIFKVELPDITDVSTGDQIQVPLSITPTSGADIYSYYAVVAYDPEILTCTAVSNGNIDLENFSGPVANITPDGKIRIAAFGTDPLDINDILLHFHFTLIGNNNDSSLLTFETFFLNEGSPTVTTKSGSVSIVEKQTYILDLDIIGNGQILVNDVLETLPFKGNFSENETVQLEIISSQNFYQWMGDISDSNSSITIVMNSNKKIDAVCNRFDFDLKKGWNLISLPVIPVDNRLASIFPDASIAYEFQHGRYINADRLIPGKGYWVKVPSDSTYATGGFQFNSFSTEFDTGWNLIGATDQLSMPENLSLTSISAVIEYSDGFYHIAYQFEPGKGYWIKTRANHD